MEETTRSPQTTRREEHFTARGPIHLRVRNHHGDITVRSTSGTEVLLELTARGPHAESFLQEVGVEFTGDQLGLDVPGHVMHGVNARTGDFFRAFREGDSDRGFFDRIGAAAADLGRFAGSGTVRLDVQVTVPEASSLDLGVGAGNVLAEGHLGDLEVNTGAGDLKVPAEVGNLRLKTGAGGIDVDVVSADARLSSGSGAVHVVSARSGSVHARTGVGDIEVGVPEGTAARLDLSTGTGHSQVDLAPREDASAAESTVDLDLSSGTGNLHIRRAEQ